MPFLAGGRHRERQGREPLLLLASALLFGACEVRDESLGRQVVPFDAGDEGAAAIAEYYTSICGQIRAAWLERDVPRVAALLATHDRDDAPGWVREQMAGYRSLLRIDASERALSRGAEVVRTEPSSVLGEPTLFEFRVPKLAADAEPRSLRLGGADDALPARFEVVVTATDHEPRGGRATNKRHVVLAPERSVPLENDPLRLPFAVEEAPPGVVLREIRIEVNLMPGQLAVDGQELPLRRTTCARGRFEVWPRGIEPIRRAPLTTLREALRLGDAEHFAHLWLGARLLPESDRELAAPLLLDAIRLGNPDLAVAAMAALRELVGPGSPPVGDREAWLAWWPTRARRAR